MFWEYHHAQLLKLSPVFVITCQYVNPIRFPKPSRIANYEAVQILIFNKSLTLSKLVSQNVLFPRCTKLAWILKVKCKSQCLRKDNKEAYKKVSSLELMWLYNYPKHRMVFCVLLHNEPENEFSTCFHPGQSIVFFQPKFPWCLEMSVITLGTGICRELKSSLFGNTNETFVW